MNTAKLEFVEAWTQRRLRNALLSLAVIVLMHGRLPSGIHLDSHPSIYSCKFIICHQHTALKHWYNGAKYTGGWTDSLWITIQFIWQLALDTQTGPNNPDT